jgi:hypothetical protein
MKGKNGTATTISDPVRIYNNDTSAHSINLKLASWDGNSQNQLYNITITLYNATTGGTKQGQSILLVPGGSGQVTETSSVSIGSRETWRVEWVIYWKSTASSETVNVHLELDVT